MRKYKRIRRIFPRVTSANPNIDVNIQVGFSNAPAGAVTWGNPINFNPNTQYKVDTLTGGRYLAIRFTVPQATDFEVAGFDCEVSDAASADGPARKPI